MKQVTRNFSVFMTPVAMLCVLGYAVYSATSEIRTAMYEHMIKIGRKSPQ